TIHREAAIDPTPILQRIRYAGATAGLAINPATPVRDGEDFLDYCDLVLVMSVVPGFGGQAFEPVALEKLSALRALAGDSLVLEVDGGVNDRTIAKCAQTGANWFVAGSSIFGTQNYSENLSKLTQLASA